MLETLLVLDQLRGIDSTGIAVIPRGNFDVNIAKSVGNAYDLFNTTQYSKAINCATRAIIGHNRSATSGSVTKRNAHPFENETIVGVHNGTLNSKYKLADSARFTVDSENLYHHMDKLGLKDCLNNMGGAWSLVWWDKTNDTLNFLRNKERPMFTTWNKDLKSLYWASEKWMLSIALSRNGVEHTEILETEVDMHYSYEISEGGVISKPHVVPAPSTYRGYETQNQQQSHGKWVGNQSTTTPPPQTSTQVAKQSVASNRYDGRFNTELEVLAKTKDPFGGEYYVCFDATSPSLQIRLYVNRKDETDLTGEIITGNISPVAYTEGSRCYHKVSSSTVSVKAKYPLVGTEFFVDKKGNKIDEKSWMKQYGTCSNCAGVVNPRFDFRFTKEGDTICHECAADEEVQQMVAMR